MPKDTTVAVPDRSKKSGDADLATVVRSSPHAVDLLLSALSDEPSGWVVGAMRDVVHELACVGNVLANEGAHQWCEDAQRTVHRIEKRLEAVAFIAEIIDRARVRA